MKHIHTPSQTFIAVKFDTTGSVDRNPLDVVKKFNIVVTPVPEIYTLMLTLSTILEYRLDINIEIRNQILMTDLKLNEAEALVKCTCNILHCNN